MEQLESMFNVNEILRVNNQNFCVLFGDHPCFSSETPIYICASIVIISYDRTYICLSYPFFWDIYYDASILFFYCFE